MSQFVTLLVIVFLNLLLPVNKPVVNKGQTTFPAGEIKPVPGCYTTAPHDGLIAFYPFNGNTNDESGHGHHGKLFNGARIVGDKNGNPSSALSVDGSNGVIVENGSPLVPEKELTISFDVMLRSQGSRQVYVSAINWQTGTGFGYFVSSSRPWDNSTIFGVAKKGAACDLYYTKSADLCIGPELEEECWYTMVMTFKKGNMKMYINGELVTESKAPFSSINSCENTNFMIGNWWTEDPIGLDGKIDNVRIYDRELTPAEIEDSRNWYL